MSFMIAALGASRRDTCVVFVAESKQDANFGKIMLEEMFHWGLYTLSIGVKRTLSGHMEGGI